MARGTRFSILAPLALATALPLGACVHHHHHDAPEVVVVQERGGPPPHAPAHGYRRKHRVEHRDVELVFDSGLGVYVVVGIPNCYFDDHRFYRLEHGVWKAAPDVKGTWTSVAESDLPPGLRPHRGPAKHDRGGPRVWDL
jgi:hypothetical protein